MVFIVVERPSAGLGWGMGLQNRVDPFGRLIRTPARGGWMGNRGLLHDAAQHIRRPWRLKAWLVCVLEFRGRRRTVMSPGLYTELFFLDEATAFAAGHRPCGECRRADYQRFKALAGDFLRVADLDAVLHGDRMDEAGRQRTFRAELAELPDGVFIRSEGEPWHKWRGRLHRWTPGGYMESRVSKDGQAEVLTPRLTVETIRRGYEPQVAL